MDHCFGMVEDGFRGEDEEGLAEGVLRELVEVGGVEPGQEAEGKVNGCVVAEILLF